MAAQLKKTVKPSSGDYTSLEACMNANEQDLVSNDKYFDVEIDGDWTAAADSSAVTIHNYTTDATRYINIYTTAAARHDGKWCATAYRLEMDTRVINSDSVSNIGLSGVQAVKTGTGTGNYQDAVLYQNTVDSYRAWDSNIFITRATGGSASAGIRLPYEARGLFTNSVFIGYYGVYTIGYFRATTTQSYMNCVFIGTGYQGFRKSGDSNRSVRVINCYAVGNGGQAAYVIAGTTHIVITTCASDDGSCSTSTVAYATDSGAYFTNVSSGTEDFHIGASSDFIGAGTDESGVFTNDIDDDTRSAWDIGVDEYQAVGGGLSIPIARHHRRLMGVS